MTVSLLLYIIALLLAVLAPFVPEPIAPGFRSKYIFSAALILVIVASIIESGVRL